MIRDFCKQICFNLKLQSPVDRCKDLPVVNPQHNYPNSRSPYRSQYPLRVQPFQLTIKGNMFDRCHYITNPNNALQFSGNRCKLP